MTGTPYQKTVSIALTAAVANGIAQSQSGTAATALTLNGSLVSSGVATLSSTNALARRVIVTSAGNDTGITFSIVGTDYYGRPQTEVLTGANGVAQTAHDFQTVTSIIPSGNTASTVTAGTNGVGSTVPMVVDAFVNPANYGATTSVSGTVTYTVEKMSDDLAPSYDLTVNNPTWYPAAGFSAQSTAIDGIITGPCNMIRLTINSGTGTATLRIIMAFLGGRA